MVVLLADANLDGHAELLAMRLATDDWREWRDHFDIRILTFDDAELDRKAKDDEVWRFCQQSGYYLLTANRNSKAEDSLEATIHRESQSNSLPVFTLADSKRLYQSASYRDEVLWSLLDYLLDETNCRGTGRLYLP